MGACGRTRTAYANSNSKIEKMLHLLKWDITVKNMWNPLCKLWNLNPSSLFLWSCKNCHFYNNLIIAAPLPKQMCLCQYLLLKIIRYLDKFSGVWELWLLQSNNVDSMQQKIYHTVPMFLGVAIWNKFQYSELIQHLPFAIFSGYDSYAEVWKFLGL